MGKRSSESSNSVESTKRFQRTGGGGAAATHPYPSGVKIIARRNPRGHYCVPRKDTTVCGTVYERVMFGSGCNTILLPFPKEGKRFETLQPFHNEHHRWEISWSGDTGGIICPTLKIHPVVEGDIGVIKFGEDYESPMPFLRFHLGTNASEWLIKNPHRLDDYNIGKLEGFLERMGTQTAIGRTTAIIGSMLLARLCVLQVGIVMFMIEAEDTSINPLHLSDACVHATNELVEEYGGFDDLYDDDNELYDRDGVTPRDED